MREGERARDKGIRSVRTHQSVEGKYVREMQPYEHCHCPPEHRIEGTGWWRATETILQPSAKTLAAWWGFRMSGKQVPCVSRRLNSTEV